MHGQRPGCGPPNWGRQTSGPTQVEQAGRLKSCFLLIHVFMIFLHDCCGICSARCPASPRTFLILPGSCHTVEAEADPRCRGHLIPINQVWQLQPLVGAPWDQCLSSSAEPSSAPPLVGFPANIPHLKDLDNDKTLLLIKCPYTLHRTSGSIPASLAMAAGATPAPCQSRTHTHSPPTSSPADCGDSHSLE